VRWDHPQKESAMVVAVYGKKGCKLCDSAKQKLDIMHVDYSVHELADSLKPHDGWRDDHTVELMTAHTFLDKMPLIRVDSTVYDYPNAIKEIKRLRTPLETQPLAAAGD
jgi:hypothetical protein